MSRQLNPDLLADPFSKSSTHKPIELLTQSQGQNFSGYLESLERIKSDLDEVKKNTFLKTERISERVSQIEIRLSAIIQDFREKMAFFGGKVRENSSLDSKMETLIDRHNQIIHNFEIKLGQAQRLIENQSVQLTKQQQATDEARRQIEKLKRL